jgi:hypothetical protein
MKYTKRRLRIWIIVLLVYLYLACEFIYSLEWMPLSLELIIDVG